MLLPPLQDEPGRPGPGGEAGPAAGRLPGSGRFGPIAAARRCGVSPALGTRCAAASQLLLYFAVRPSGGRDSQASGPRGREGDPPPPPPPPLPPPTPPPPSPPLPLKAAMAASERQPHTGLGTEGRGGGRASGARAGASEGAALSWSPAGCEGRARAPAGVGVVAGCLGLGRAWPPPNFGLTPTAPRRSRSRIRAGPFAFSVTGGVIHSALCKSLGVSLSHRGCDSRG